MSRHGRQVQPDAAESPYRHLPDCGHRELWILAPVLAKKSPAVLDAITQHPPVVGINGLAAITFMVGYLLFGLAMIRTASLPRLAGILVAVGAPAHLIGFGLAQLVSPALWSIAVAGSISLGALAWPGPAIDCGTHGPLQADSLTM